VRQGPDIEAGRNGHLHAQQIVVQTLQGEGVHGHCLRLGDRRVTGASQVVHPHAADLLGRVWWRRLRDLAGKPGLQPRQRIAVELRHRAARVRRLALAVVGCGGVAEPDLAAIGLLPAHQILLEAGCLPDAQHEQALSHRVEGAGVADPALSERPAGDVHNVV
jgi:hypothetical protein